MVRKDENLCLLERSYLAGDKRMSLIFQPLLDLSTMELYVISADQSDKQYDGMFSTAVEPGARTLTGHYFSARSSKLGARITRLMIDRTMLDELKDGDTISVQAKPVDRRFVIVRPEKALVALQGCVTELKKSWGIDPDTAARVVTTLKGNPGSYFGPDVYPALAQQDGIYGRVIALLNIGTDGAVEHCRIVSSAGAALNAGTCKAATRIKFTPALDKDGKPLRSTYTLPVRWVLPGVPD